VFPGQRGYLRRLFGSGVILPQPGHSGTVFTPLVLEGQREAGGVDRNGCGAGGIDADADHSVGGEAVRIGSFLNRCSDATLQAGQIVGRVLPGQIVIAGIEDDALVPSGIVEDRRADRTAIAAVHDDGADGIGAVVDAD